MRYKPDDRCGPFRYRDFFECSETWRATKVENVPKSERTYLAIDELVGRVLAPISEVFGAPELTHGFCSQNLQKKIRGGILPKKDQHAGYESLPDGQRICQRDGMAADFIVPGICSLEIAKWIASNTAFDRLYFYGSDRPLHVSIAPTPIQQIVLMTRRSRCGNRIPSVISKSHFVALQDG